MLTFSISSVTQFTSILDKLYTCNIVYTTLRRWKNDLEFTASPPQVTYFKTHLSSCHKGVTSEWLAVLGTDLGNTHLVLQEKGGWMTLQDLLCRKEWDIGSLCWRALCVASPHRAPAQNPPECFDRRGLLSGTFFPHSKSFCGKDLWHHCSHVEVRDRVIGKCASCL